ncbi:MAG TPA: hypothetical protein VL614_30980 [Acetobacteraceae bacterium]|nr:hypothetical protein [Acetobacteraceae bacterium]
MNEIRAPGDAPRLPAPEQASPLSPVPTFTQGASEPRMTVRDVLVQFFYCGPLLRNCILLGVFIGLLAAALTRTEYTADSLVLVLIGSESTSAQNSSGITPTVLSIDGLKAVQSEIQIATSDEVLRTAIRKVGAGSIYPWLVRPRWFGLLPPREPSTVEGLAVERLRSDLRVESDAGSNVIRISFASPERPVAIEVVQAVLDAFLEQRRTIYASTNATFVGREIDRYRDSLAKLDTQIQDLRSHYNVLDMAQDVVLATNRLDGVVQRQNQVRERQVAVQTEIAAVKTNLAGQPQTVLDFRESTNNTGNDEARNTLVRLEQQRTHLINQYKPDWPGIAAVNQQIASARDQMGPHEKNLYFTERQIRNPAIELLNNRLASLEVENQALGEQLVELDQQYKQADDRVQSLRTADGQLHGLQLTRDVTEGVYRQLAQRQQAAVFQDHVVDERNANLRVVQTSTAPVVGRSMALSYVLGGLILGMLLGAAAAAIATLMREVYIMPSEAERDLLMPALISLDSSSAKPHRDDQPEIADLGSLLQEATVDRRSLATLQIIGVSDEDDRVAIVRKLATELAVGHERNTLILDLESDGAEYTSALGTADDPATPARTLPMRVVATRVPRLWVGVSTLEPVFGDRRASVVHTRRILDELHEEFSMILLVASADLSGYAVRRLANMVDANIVIVRAERTRGAVVTRLCDVIRSGGGNLLGFIFDGRKYYVPSWLYRWA